MQSKFFKSIFIAFLCVFFFFLVLSNAPATWVAWGIHKAAPNVWLTGVSGSLWRGSAETSQVDINKNPIALGTISWNISPWSFLTLSACMDIEAVAPGQSVSGNVCQSISGSTSLSDVSVELPVARLQKLLPTAVVGHLSLQIRSAEVSNQRFSELDGQVGLQQAKISVENTWYSFGTFAAKLSESQAGGVDAKLFDIDSPYKFDLNATWLIGEPWQIAGVITPQASAPELAVQALQTIGEDAGSGGYRVQWPL